MNFLQLVQRLRAKVRASGTGPTTVVGQTGEYLRLVDAVNEAWMEIQRKRRDWFWLRNSMTFPTVAGQATYTLAQIGSTGTNFADFSYWDRKTFRNYLTATGLPDEQWMGWITFDHWRDVYQMQTTRTTQQRPQYFTTLPNLGLGLVTPLAGYTIGADYFKKATEMAADLDEPALPSEFHMAIVYLAMQTIGVSEAKPEIYDEGKIKYTEIMSRLEDQQLPEIEMPETLA